MNEQITTGDIETTLEVLEAVQDNQDDEDLQLAISFTMATIKEYQAQMRDR